jgi:hypothetical protein
MTLVAIIINFVEKVNDLLFSYLNSMAFLVVVHYPAFATIDAAKVVPHR